MTKTAILLLAALAIPSVAQARPHHRPSHHSHHSHAHHHKHRVARLDANGNRVTNLVTVDTAAGISIRVAADFAASIGGFITDLVARGVHPGRIHCFAATGHARHSLHHSGHACDFDGSANRFEDMNRNRVSDLAAKWGLRDGCEFDDCGHIDAGFASFASARRIRARAHLHFVRAHRVHRRHLARR